MHLKINKNKLKSNKNKNSTELETYLIDLFFRVCQQVGEVCEHFAVKNNLCLLISPCHNVPHCPQSRCLQFEDVQLKKKLNYVVIYKYHLTMDMIRIEFQF